MTLNGQSLAVDVASVNTINYHGSGSDTVTLTGLGNDFAELYPTAVRLAAPGNAYTVNVSNSKTITVNSSGTNSLTYFHTGDTYTGSPLFSSASDGATYTITAKGFRHNDCFAMGATAVANLTTAATGADEYGGVPAFSFVQGPNDSYDDYAVGFAKVYGSANGNTSAQAYLGMTAVGDTYTSNDSQRTDTVQGATYFSQAQGFSFVAVYAASHTTSKAVITTAPGDTFIGNYSYDTVVGPGTSYQHYLFGFPQVTATGNTNTAAYLQRFSGNNATDPIVNDLAGNAESSGPGYDNKVENFAQVVVTIYPN